MPDNANITAPRVPLTDPKTGLVSREWYNFFLVLFNLTGAGQNAVSLTDLQGGPPPVALEDVTAIVKAVQGLQEAPGVAGLIERVAELVKAVEALQAAPVATPSGTTVLSARATLNFPNTAAGGTSDLTINLPGAVDGDVVCLVAPNASVPAAGTYFPWVSAPDTVTVRFANNSAGAVDPASGEFRVIVTRY